MNNIRNFCIISHVDHGKSTLADRLLEITGTVPKEKLRPQLLDSLALERERGITIKLAPVRLKYEYRNPKSETNSNVQNTNDQNNFEFRASNFEFTDSEYILNLIDTPGHVDFSYEVSRSLAAVEGAILLVDATQGIQAQTLAHGLSALDQNLTLIPVINKIDLENADIAGTRKQLVETFGFDESEILLASGKTGEGVEGILKVIVERIPTPKSAGVNLIHPKGGSTFKALIFDSFYDPFKGVVAEVRLFEGETPKIQSPIVFLGTKATGQVLETGYFSPQLIPTEELREGEIGYIATGIKQPDLVRVGDTISTDLGVQSLPGYKQVKPMVFVGLFPLDQDEFPDAKEALSKFRLNDPSFTFELESSQALGSGFRCGFLGLLHAEVVQERLHLEFGVDLLATSPSVEYLVNGESITNPSSLDPSMLKNVKEPWVKLKIFVPQKYIGGVMDLAQEKRGKFINMQHFATQVELSYEMPLAEMVTDFYDKLKSISSGFASLDWEFLEFREVDAVRVDILVAGEKVDALSQIVVKERAENFGRRMVGKLKEVLPRQNFEVAIQAAIGGKIIARETLSSFRKDVTAKLYGGDRTRKDKLLEKQKRGKKKMKMVGRVEIPQEAFLNILKS
ncbi:elongation factor 4 [Candidatus Daviesbacteria bacterium]|nr:elongation factor 4 [Candidatus Daviesbacteria bacterium]